MTSENSTRPRDLVGRAAIVAGASRGIGKAVAAELLARGAGVLITARKPEPLEAAASELSALGHGGKVVAFAGNAADAEARSGAVDRAVSEFGSLDILVNNTGNQPRLRFTHGSGPRRRAQDLRRECGCRPRLRPTSTSGMDGRTRWSRREPGKCGRDPVDGRHRGVRRVEGCAHPFDGRAGLATGTEDSCQRRSSRDRQDAVRGSPGRCRRGQGVGGLPDEAARHPPKDVAGLVGFLVSDAAAWITGETVRVDGGLLATGSM